MSSKALAGSDRASAAQPVGDQRDTAPSFLAQFYDIQGVIGEGTFGKVFLAISKAQPGRRLAVKCIKPGKEQEGVCVTALREIMLLKAISHPNVITLDGMHMDVQNLSLSLAFDYAEHDMYEIIRYHRDLGQPVPLHTIKSLMHQLFKGLAYLHSNWLMHRDLKPSNILVMGPGEEHGTLKIADFGLARVFRDPLEPLWNNGLVVTIWYRAPELLLGARHYTTAVDLWAAGCIMAELFTLRPLFHGEERKGGQDLFQDDQMNKIFTVLGHPSSSPGCWPLLESLAHWRDNSGNVRMRRPEHGSISIKQLLWKTSPLMSYFHPEAALDLLSRLLTLDPSSRITAQQALDHPFFTQDPLPGRNAFVHHGQRMFSYPSRPVRK